MSAKGILLKKGLQLFDYINILLNCNEKILAGPDLGASACGDGPDWGPCGFQGAGWGRSGKGVGRLVNPEILNYEKSTN